MLDTLTPYDTLAYPSAVFPQAQPDRLAAVARLHGLSPPPIETARMLDIGGGDGLNTTALATAFPHAQFVNFDLAPSAVARGQAWADGAGASNVRHLVLDILEAADRLEGTFDYITAHGVYAWVPEPVRAAIFPLIGRLLSPNGVAMVSYNAMPGGYSRLAIRGLLAAHLDPALPPRARLANARALLTAYREPQEDDQPIVASMRREAEAMLKRPDDVLYHDELGPCFYPQAVGEVAAAAAASGLAYLNDAGKDLLGHGFVWDDDEPEPDTKTLVARLNALDFVQGRYFRNSIFVRAEVVPARRLDLAALSGLWASALVTEEGGIFKAAGGEVEVGDSQMAAGLRRLGAVWPDRICVSDLFSDPDHLHALFRLVTARMIELHSVPSPFATTPGERPEASPLIRHLLAQGLHTTVTLDHRPLALNEAGPRAFLALLDGTRDRAALERDWQASGHAAEVPLEMALQLSARGAMLQR